MLGAEKDQAATGAFGAIVRGLVCLSVGRVLLVLKRHRRLGLLVLRSRGSARLSERRAREKRREKRFAK